MKKGVTKIEGYEFIDDDVVLDFSFFSQCSFERCNIIFYGHGPTQAESCTFVDCKYSLAGPSLATLHYMAQIYSDSNSGGKQIVEAWIDQMKAGHLPAL